MLIMMKSLKMIDYSLFDHVRGNPKIQWICFYFHNVPYLQRLQNWLDLFRWALMLHYVYVGTQTRKLPMPVRDRAIPVLVPILELPSVHFLSTSSGLFCYFGQYWQHISFAVLVLSQLSRVCTGTGIRLMPIPVQACQYQYSHILGARSSIVFLLLTMPVLVQAFLQCLYGY